MLKFTLNDENIKNSYGFKILTSGIDLERFRLNPVMLDGHNSSNEAVVGLWENISIEEGLLVADAHFDTEDDRARALGKKVEKGLIKGASMGVAFNREDLNMIEGELVLQKCELFEASIVAIPSNANAVRLYLDGEILAQNQVEKLCLSATKKIKTFNKNNMIKLSQLAFIALGFAATQNEASEQDINTAVLALSKQKEELEQKLQNAETKVLAFENAEIEKQKLSIDKTLNEAIASGKITADKREVFKNLAAQNFEIFTQTLEALPAKKTFGAGVQTPAGNFGVSNMEDFQKLSLAEQLAFKNENPEAYAQLLKK